MKINFFNNMVGDALQGIERKPAFIEDVIENFDKCPTISPTCFSGHPESSLLDDRSLKMRPSPRFNGRLND